MELHGMSNDIWFNKYFNNKIETPLMLSAFNLTSVTTGFPYSFSKSVNVLTQFDLTVLSLLSLALCTWTAGPVYFDVNCAFI